MLGSTGSTQFLDIESTERPLQLAALSLTRLSHFAVGVRASQTRGVSEEKSMRSRRDNDCRSLRMGLSKDIEYLQYFSLLLLLLILALSFSGEHCSACCLNPTILFVKYLEY